jgi:hypothetical protein
MILFSYILIITNTMGTGSRIGILIGDKIHSVQVGYDGYLSGVGKVLMKRFNTEEKVLELIKGGEIRTLTEPEVEYYNCNTNNEVLYDVDESANEFVKRASSRFIEYYYLMENGNWFCGDTMRDTFMSYKLIYLPLAIKTDEDITLSSTLADEECNRLKQLN